MIKNGAYEKFSAMVKELDRIPTLAEWLEKSGYSRTTYFANKKIFREVIKQVAEGEDQWKLKLKVF